MSKNLTRPITILILAIFAGIVAWGNIPGDIRIILLFAFTLICPGMALVGLLNIKDRLAEIMLSIALSLTLSTILAEAMILTRFWRPFLGLAMLIGISLLGVALQFRSVLRLQKTRSKVHVSLY